MRGMMLMTRCARCWWRCSVDEDEFTPLTEEEMAAFKDEVWQSWATGEISEAEAANMILHEAWLNGLIEA